MNTASRLSLALGVALLVIACDWASKPLAEALLEEQVITNDKPPLAWTLPAALAACLTLAALIPSRLVALAAGILAGGWAANLLDRMLFGPVTDFIPLPAGYVGNLADAAVITGQLLLLGWLAARTPLGRRALSRA